MANIFAYNKPLASAVANGLINTDGIASTSGKNVDVVVEATGVLTAALQATGLFFGAKKSTSPRHLVALPCDPGVCAN